MNNNLIFIPIELPVRESFSSAMLGSFLSLKGLKVVIGAQSQIKEIALNSSNSIYLDKTLYSAHKDFYEKINDKKISIFCDDIEASGCHVPELYAMARFSKRNIDLTKGIFFWGQDDYSAIKKFYNICESKVHKKGSFRTYYWKYYSQKIPNNIDKSRELRKKYKDFVFIPSNFGGSMRPDGIEGVINQAKYNYPELLPKIKDRINHIERRRESFVKSIKKLVQEHQNINFIFRPHPNEEIGKWNEVFPKKENFFIEYEGSVTEYILASKAIIHSGCTSAFECFFYDKPCIAYIPDRNPVWDSWQANAMSFQEETYDSLNKRLIEIVFDKYENFFQSPFYSIDKDLLDYYYEVFNEELKNLQGSPINLNNSVLVYRIKNKIKKILNLGETLSQKKFNKDDMMRLIERVKYFNESFKFKCNITKLTDKVILLERI